MKQVNLKKKFFELAPPIVMLIIIIIGVTYRKNQAIPIIFSILITLYFIGLQMLSNNKFENTKTNLKTKAESDSLTGLYNKEATRDHIEEFLIGEGKYGCHALFIIDIDDFKQINDTFGHLEGDNILKQLSLEIKSLFRNATIIGRVGGDEFMVFLKNITNIGLIQLKAAELCEVMQFTYIGNTKEFTISGTVGVSIKNSDDIKTFNDIYKEADMALYDAKRQGKNRFSIYSHISKDEENTSKDINSEEISFDKLKGNNSIQLKALLDNMDGGVLLLEVGETIRSIYCSNGYFNMTKTNRKEYMRYMNDVSQLVYYKDIPKFEDAIKKGAAYGEPVDLVYRNTLINGDIGWRHIRVVRIPYEDSDKPVVIAVITDVTKIKEQQENLKLAFDQTNLNIWKLNIKSRKITFPKIKKEFNNVPYKQIEDGTIHKDSIDIYKKFCESIFSGDETGSCTIKMKFIRDEYNFYRMSFRNTYNKDGKACKAIGVLEPLFDVDKENLINNKKEINL